MPSGILKITGIPLDLETIDCDIKITDEKISSLLAEDLMPKKKRPTKKPGEKEAEDKLQSKVEQFMMFIGCGDEYQQKKKVAF
jgi:hypothetical protein